MIPPTPLYTYHGGWFNHYYTKVGPIRPSLSCSTPHSRMPLASCTGWYPLVSVHPMHPQRVCCAPMFVCGVTPFHLHPQSEEELGLKNKRGDAHFSTGRPIQTVPNGVDDILNTHFIR